MLSETGLQVQQVSVAYGLHQALDQVSLDVKPGEIVVILGANGAGKSSLLKTIGGIVPRISGSIEVNGVVTSGMRAHAIVEAGIALVPEGRGVFGELSVAENLALGAYNKRAQQQQQSRLQQVFQLFPKLVERKAQLVRTMSGGEQQMVAIGRALMSAPSILMLDEPSLGLSPLLTSEVFKTLLDIKKTGLGILLVEQNAKQSLAIADRGYLLENGRIKAQNSAQALLHDDAVRAAYLGGNNKNQNKPAEKNTPEPGVKPIGVFNRSLQTKPVVNSLEEELTSSAIHDWIVQAEVRQRQYWLSATKSVNTIKIPEPTPEGALNAMLRRMEQTARQPRKNKKN